MKNLEELKNQFSKLNWPKGSHCVERLWTFAVSGSLEQVWPFVADSSRFNRALGFAGRHHQEYKGKLLVQDKLLGFSQEWIEEPWSWNFAQSMSVQRTYIRGAAKRFLAVYWLEPLSTDKVLVHIYFGWQARSWIWKMILDVGLQYVGKKMKSVFERIDQQILSTHKKGVVPRMLRQQVECDPEVLKKIRAISAQMVEQQVSPVVVDRLCDYISYADSLELDRIRIVPLAKEWRVPQKDLLVACLHATRLGMLTLSWDLICPHCRGVREEANTLEKIPETSHCDVCHVTFETVKETAVEVTFHVHPNIRKIDSISYCAAEPAKKEHIKAQFVLGTKEKMNVNLNLHAGRYRLRCVGSDSEHILEVAADIPDSDETLVWNAENSEVKLHTSSSKVNLTIYNDSSQEKIFVVEEAWWHNRALKPVDLFSLQDFRDLFSKEHLAANVKLNLGNQVILFTDIVGSTKFYRTQGDAVAFLKVKEHFQEVFDKIRNHHGVVVKTIGDSVMSAFSNSHDAFQAAMGIQKQFHGGSQVTPIRLRVSMHMGPVMAVHWNTGIDYFGNTVNFSAKLQSYASAEEIALSTPVFSELLRLGLISPECTVEHRPLTSHATDVLKEAVVVKLNAASTDATKKIAS